MTYRDRTSRSRAATTRKLLVLAVLAVIPALSQAEGVSIETSAYAYAQGDSVFMTLRNDTDFSIIMGSRPPYVIFDDITGEEAYGFGLPWELVMGPHESEVYAWDQRDIAGEVLPASRYRVDVGYVFEPGGTWHVASDVFVTLALDPAAVDDDPPSVSERTVTWGRIRTLAR
jgi:hypothetical protein